MEVENRGSQREEGEQRNFPAAELEGRKMGTLLQETFMDDIPSSVPWEFPVTLV